VSESKVLVGELQSAGQMSEMEWLEYETLILEVSDFSDTSEIDGLLCSGWLASEDLATPAFLSRYFVESDNPEALPRVNAFLARHANWVRLRCAHQPEQLPAEIPPLNLDFDLGAEQFAVCFDPQLWLLGWQQGMDGFAVPEFDGDSRVVQAYDLICMAAAQTDEMFSDDALDEPVEMPTDLTDEDFAEELLDLASPAELAISDGVMMTVDLIPRILPMLRESDGVALDDLLFQLDSEIEQAREQLNSEIEAAELVDGEGLYGARMDWVSGRDDRLDEEFFAASERGRLAQSKIDEIEALWRDQIEFKQGLPFEYVDGFLSAYRVTPNNESLDLQHILFPLFAEQADGLGDDKVVEIVRALEAFHGHIGARGLIDDCIQISGVPAQVDRYLQLDDAEAASKIGACWSEGFRSGLSYFCPVFGTYLQQDKLLFALILPLIQLSFQPEGWEHEFTLAERRELVAGIPETLFQIGQQMHKQAHRPVRQGTKVGRNDPCPCGSGKKYKKCCGAS